MNLSVFLKLVEIQTKVASFFPVLIGTLFSYYRYGQIKPVNILIMFISLLCIDLATTTLNNLMDYKRAVKKEGFNFESHNAIVKYKLSEKTVIITILILLIIGALTGLFLVYNTDLVVLFVGIISFAVGVLYSYGPLPISRTPLGELFSGFFMGFFIFFLAVYINIYDKGLITYFMETWNLSISVNIVEISILLLVSSPLVLGISNIMLANNICDIEDDTENNRYTLPIYIGREKALIIFNLSYLAAFIAIVFLVILKILPVFTLATLVVFVPIWKFVKEFNELQTKKDTFAISVKSFLLMGIAYSITLVIGIVLL